MPTISCVPRVRRIASNLLLDSRGLHRNPLVELDDGGGLVSVRCEPQPDREPFTEFYAGLLVVGLEGFDPAQLHADRTTPLPELLTPHLNPDNRRVVLLTGLDYDRLTPTDRTRLHLL